MATLTRQELYDLVWACPRTELAAKLGVSDVAIGKACIRENVPAPPRGYWARKEAGQELSTTPLPLREPGQFPHVEVGEREEDGPAFYSVPPSFPEDVQTLVAAALARIDPWIWRRKELEPHKALRRVQSDEARRRQQVAKTGPTFQAPRFEGADHRRQLAIFNRLAHAVDPAASMSAVEIHEDYVRGAGTTWHLRLHAGGSVYLAFAGQALHRKASNSQHKNGVTLHLEAGHDARISRQWDEGNGDRLETQLPQIAADILRHREESMRAWMLECYQHEQERIAQSKRAKEEQDAALVRQQAEKAAAAEQARRDDLTAEAARWHQATQIRTYVAHLDVSGAADAKWRAWALLVADEIDPTRSRL